MNDEDLLRQQLLEAAEWIEEKAELLDRLAQQAIKPTKQLLTQEAIKVRTRAFNIRSAMATIGGATNG